jgi:hypothetical protein
MFTFPSTLLKPEGVFPCSIDVWYGCIRW